MMEIKKKEKNQLLRMTLLVVSAIAALIALAFGVGNIIAGLVKVLMAWFGVGFAAIFMVGFVFCLVGGLFYFLRILKIWLQG